MFHTQYLSHYWLDAIHSCYGNVPFDCKKSIEWKQVYAKSSDQGRTRRMYANELSCNWELLLRHWSHIISSGQYLHAHPCLPMSLHIMQICFIISVTGHKCSLLGANVSIFCSIGNSCQVTSNSITYDKNGWISATYNWRKLMARVLHLMPARIF